MAFELKKDPKKIFICGTGTGWQQMNPNTNAILYCLNDYVRIEKYGVKPDKLFIMDVLDEKPMVVSGVDNLGEVVARINQLKVPLVAPYKYAEIPLSEEFPLEEVVKKFGIPYFSNTICYMIAYALLQNPEEIEIYGVNQAGSHEYHEERSAVEYWLGIAHGLGVKVTLHGKHSTLLKFKGKYGRDVMYGYLQNLKEYRDIKKKFGEQVIHRLSDPRGVARPDIKRTIK